MSEEVLSKIQFFPHHWPSSSPEDILSDLWNGRRSLIVSAGSEFGLSTADMKTEAMELIVSQDVLHLLSTTAFPMITDYPYLSGHYFMNPELQTTRFSTPVSTGHRSRTLVRILGFLVVSIQDPDITDVCKMRSYIPFDNRYLDVVFMNPMTTEQLNHGDTKYQMMRRLQTPRNIMIRLGPGYEDTNTKS